MYNTDEDFCSFLYYSRSPYDIMREEINVYFLDGLRSLISMNENATLHGSKTLFCMSLEDLSDILKQELGVNRIVHIEPLVDERGWVIEYKSTQDIPDSHLIRAGDLTDYKFSFSRYDDHIDIHFGDLYGYIPRVIDDKLKSLFEEQTRVISKLMKIF